MIYLGTAPNRVRIRAAMMDGKLGLMNTPGQSWNLNKLPGVTWAADNGAFSVRGWIEDKWLRFLDTMAPHQANCLFAVAPDVVGDWEATIARSEPWFDVIRAKGYKVALVAQNGLEDPADVPWSEIDCLFIGGDTRYKLSETSRLLVKHAKAEGKWAHMGRVNSRHRILLAHDFGCDSVDGTCLAYDPFMLDAILKAVAECK